MQDDDPATDETPHKGGLFDNLLISLTQICTTVVTMAHTRLELLTTELQEEIQRATILLLWAFIALFAAGIGLFLAALATIFAFWDTHRLLVSVVVTAVFFAIAAAASVVLAARLRNRPPILNSTLAELARDRDRLKSRL